ncbi:FkbM family methyltransferase [Marinimicrobium agarilyticum]|uniref:FkbM family methyltransferase n=1 Tax=Marinimicrobium agarilyticum TaxID=306546 RepID=UPI00041DF478|nr:FkbM family methyltransferase [Marinimicrobium agarilyticum]
MIKLCHRPSAPVISRLCAPIVRKCLLKRRSLLPVDLRLGSFNLRCYFTDNYSEKKFVFTPWRYDFRERQMLTECLGQGGVFVDIGANVGLYTLTAARALAGKPGRIIAFEPNPPTLARLKTNIEANPELFGEPLRLDLLPIGVADRELVFTLQVDSDNLGASSIAQKSRSFATLERKSSVEIQCRPLLDVLAELNVEKVDALKIDIEGAEDLALGPYLEQAPEALLARCLFIENSQHLWSVDLFAQMERRGYRRAYVSRMNSVFVRE